MRMKINKKKEKKKYVSVSVEEEKKKKKIFRRNENRVPEYSTRNSYRMQISCP